MERPKTIPRRRKKESPLVLFLLLVLLITTLATPFSYFRPQNRLAAALKKSSAEFSQDDVLRFLGEVLWDGSFEAKGEHNALSYTATLPESAAMSETGNLGNRRVALQSDTLYLYSDVLGENAFSAPRKNASAKISDSAFSDAGMPDAQMRLLRAALAVSDPSFTRMGDTLGTLFSRSWHAGNPTLQTVGDRIEIDGKKEKVTVFTYETDKDGMEKMLSVWKSEGRREETKEACAAFRSVLSALFSPNETEEAAKRFTAFLCGESPEFEAFERKLLSENSRVCLTLTVCKGRLLTANFLLGGGFVLEAKLSLDKNIRKNAIWSASVQAKTEEKQLFALAVDSAITEDSDSALIRKWNYSYSDTIGAICPSQGEEAGAVTFSWGKKKGDLGLRMLLGEEELVLRGELQEYKKGRKLSFSVGRVEYNRRNILEEDSYTVTLSKKGETPVYREATEPLFPEDGRRQELANLLAGRFQRFDP